MEYTENDADDDAGMNNSETGDDAGGKPNVARLAEPFVCDGVWENDEWELLEYDPDAVFESVCSEGVTDCDKVCEMSKTELVDYVVDVVDDECGVRFSRGVVLATKKEIMKEYDLSVEVVVLYLMKNDGEEKKFESVVSSFGNENKRNLNPKVLMQNTYHSIKHLFTRVNRVITRNKKQPRAIRNNNVNDNE